MFATRARGSRIWDSDAREFIDFIMGFGSILLGHADIRVDQPVIDAIRRGVGPTLNTAMEVELANELCMAFDNGENSAAAFGRTGSDATALAVRLARAATGRNVIIRCGYNGWHDWCAPRAPGVPQAIRDLVIKIPYNDREAAEAAVARAGADLAGVISIPMEVHPPVDGFLDRLADLAHRAGAGFILDEVRTGLRLGLRGARAFLGVDADAVTLSKALANGFALSAVVGRRDLLSHVGDVSFSSVYHRSTDGFAAGLAMTRLLQDGEIIDGLWSLAERHHTSMQRIAAESDLPVRIVGLPVMPFHEFDLGSAALNAEASEVFSAVAAEHGVLYHPHHHWFLAASMDQDDLDRGLDAMVKGYAAVTAWAERVSP